MSDVFCRALDRDQRTSGTKNMETNKDGVRCYLAYLFNSILNIIPRSKQGALDPIFSDITISNTA